MVPVGICHLDCDGRYTYVNDRYVEITGRTRGALIGNEWSSFIHVEDVQRIRDGWTAAWKAGTAYVCEYRYEQPGGHVRYVQGEMQTDRYSAAGRSGYIAAVTDITRRKQAEAELLIAKHQAESANLAKTPLPWLRRATICDSRSRPSICSAMHSRKPICPKTRRPSRVSSRSRSAPWATYCIRCSTSPSSMPGRSGRS